MKHKIISIIFLLTWLCLGLLLFLSFQKDKHSIFPPTEYPVESEHQRVIKTPIFDGFIYYNYQKKMLHEKVNRYEVIISCEVNKEKLAERWASLKSSGNVKSDSIKVGEYMKIKLIDPTEKNFKITELSTDKQKVVIEEGTYENTWQWDVIPLEVDSLPLRVKVWANYLGEEFDIPVYDATIHVLSEKQKIHWAVFPFAFLCLLIPFYFGYIKYKRKQLKYTLAKNDLNSIKQLIAKNKLQASIDKLSELSPKSDVLIHKELASLSARLSKVESEKIKNTIAYEMHDLETSKIRDGIMVVLGKLG